MPVHVAPIAAVASPSEIRFLWWNVHQLPHFEHERRNEVRRPRTAAAFEAKAGAVAKVLHEAVAEAGPFALIALTELTEEAANHLRDAVFPEHMVTSLDIQPNSTFQVAVLHGRALRFEVQKPLIVPLTPSTTRPMVVVDLLHGDSRIRFIACHFTGFNKPVQQETRRDIASFLGREAYDYLREAEPGRIRHLVILGDLNEETYDEILELRLHAHRDRDRSRKPHHHTDANVKRVHLYNCAFRLVGEQRPHDGTMAAGGIAGTYYSEKQRWRTWDQVIVSGSLLSHQAPFLDESALRIVAVPSALTDGRPTPFIFDDAGGGGVSDHLPIAGRIVLEGAPNG